MKPYCPVKPIYEKIRATFSPDFSRIEIVAAKPSADLKYREKTH